MFRAYFGKFPAYHGILKSPPCVPYLKMPIGWRKSLDLPTIVYTTAPQPGEIVDKLIAPEVRPTQFHIRGIKDDDGIRDFKDLDERAQELINAAIEARLRAYCPYSDFAVGAALRIADGSIYTGCNIENASYPAGICAERTAAVKAVSEGKVDFIGCAVVAWQPESFTTPCGVCRQFLAEFAAMRDFPVYVTKPVTPPLRVVVTTISELLPRSFALK